MKNCRTCKYWSVNKWIENGVADCTMVDSIIREKDKTFEIESHCHDDSGLTVNLMTGKNFGCIHHQEKKHN